MGFQARAPETFSRSEMTTSCGITQSGRSDCIVGLPDPDADEVAAAGEPRLCELLTFGYTCSNILPTLVITKATGEQ
jgi:hypothetical protein